MAKAKKKFQLNSDILRILMLVVGSIFTTLVLAFSVIAIIEINHGNYANAPKYLFWIFIFLSFTHLRKASFFISFSLDPRLIASSDLHP